MRLFKLAILALCIIFTLAGVHAVDDRSPPELVKFDFQPKDVDTSESSQNITFTAHIKDDSSGVFNGSYNAPISHIDIYSPLWDSKVTANFSSALSPKGNLVPGNAQDGVYVAKVTIPMGSSEGFWYMDKLYLVDNMANSEEIGDVKMRSYGFPTYFQVDWALISWSAAKLILPGFIFLLILWAFIIHATGFKRVKPGIKGFFSEVVEQSSMMYKNIDGTASTSKVQCFIWTFVALFGYTAVFFDRVFIHADFTPPENIPANLLVALGLSIATSLTSNHLISHSPSCDTVQGFGGSIINKNGLFNDRNGDLDLSKIQMIAWTIVGVVVFLVGVFRVVYWEDATPELPDINTSLIALMGLGQGAYLGKKLATRGEGTDSVARSSGEDEPAGGDRSPSAPAAPSSTAVSSVSGIIATPSASASPGTVAAASQGDAALPIS